MHYAVFLVNCTSAWYVHKKFFLILRLMTYTDFCSVGRSVSIPQQNETVKQNIREIDRHDRRYRYIPSLFADSAAAAAFLLVLLLLLLLLLLASAAGASAAAAAAALFVGPEKVEKRQL